ncbi:transglutaminase-like domain-containing protein [Agitococcus lubricus]|uniref:Transglutaminase-like putative cysteine protease n=1 Tax=Agitococcus lubricus TaxID=1077255 RepID=A0A2T5J232_9GAMM|nr:transglutaminase family protein [Agitococcus lubricus]PTQ90506.1 transglutaminase-like putative cysteine protease [Agitococcus lubricus]
MLSNHKLLKHISLVVLTCYISLITQPVQAAIQQEVFARPKPKTDNSTPISQLEQMRELVKKLQLQNSLDAKPNRTTALVQWQTRQQQRAKLSTEQVLALQQGFEKEQQAQQAQFAQVEQHIMAKKLPAEILQRHQDTVKQVQARHQQLQNSLQALAKAQQQNNALERDKALDTLNKQLDDWAGERAQYTDSKHLPWSSPSNKVRAPLDSKQAYLQHLHDVLGVKPLQVASVGATLPTGTVWPVLPKLPFEVQATDTAANEDVQLTPAIQAKAAELDHNPAKIYKWVYDNIDFVPTYGSIQGADFTLQSKRGNAFDTSSLLIALLRASNIPARYVYGTIDVPTPQLLNWVGGVQNVDAAQNLMGQGGIPNVALTKGGVDVAVRMEHVWVEAYVDYVPSRGVVNKTPDTWIALDAAYKINQYTAATNVQQAVPFDAQALITAAQQGATVNEQGGYVQNLNQQAVQSALTDYQARLQSYIQQNPTATVGDILGTKTIKQYASRSLSAGLPYKLVAVAGDYHTLPDTMRHYFSIKLYQNASEARLNEASTDLKISTVKLAGQPFAISFKPATAADEQTINSYLPKPHADGTPIQPSELPQAMTGYLIKLSPEITLNGQLLNNPSTASFMMGEQIYSQLGFISPNQSPVLTEKMIEAGEYHALGIDLQGLSQQQLTSLKTQLESTKTKLESQDPTQLATLTKHDLTGALLQVGVQSYFALNDVQDKIASSQANVITNRFLSFGTFSSNLQPNLKYGFPLNVRFAGMMMDIDRLMRQAVAKNNDKQELIAFVASQGPRQSANEHLIPEQLFDDPTTNITDAEAVSAVKALQLAAEAGQKIFTVTQANINTVLPQLNHKAVIMEDVRNAVNAGKVVTISQRAISYNGWTGAGYSIVDTQTGAGAYLIGGGADGAIMTAFIQSMIRMAEVMPPYIMIGMGVGLVGMTAYLSRIINNGEIVAAITLVGVGLTLVGTGKIINNKTTCRLGTGLMMSGLSTLMRLAGIFGTPVGSAAARLRMAASGATAALIFSYFHCEGLGD